MENNNEYSHLTLEELWDLQSAKEKELQEQLDAPVNYYTYLSAMSQLWGIEATRVEIRRLQDEIDKRIRPAKRE
jgi:regulator of protease activity HflC (stomatin/prohibitin superfamily)